MKSTTFALAAIALGASAAAAIAADATSTTPAPAVVAQPVAAAGGPGERHHRMFEEIDTNKDGSISKEEWIAKGDKMFKERDTNADGKVTQDEMKAHHDQKREAYKQMHDKVKEGKPGQGKPDVVPAAKPEVK